MRKSREGEGKRKAGTRKGDIIEDHLSYMPSSIGTDTVVRKQ